MERDIREMIRSCIICQYVKPTNFGALAPGETITPTRPNQLVAIDCVTGLPMSREGHKVIVTFVDHFSKFGIAVPLRTKSSKSICDAFMQYWIPLFGVPQTLHSDEGETDATIIINLCSMLNVEKSRGPVFSPQSDGNVEALNKTLGMMIRSELQGKDVQDWHLLIPFMMNAYNNLVHTATGYTPATLVFGRNISNHIIPLVPLGNPIISKSRYLQALRRGQSLNWQITHAKLLEDKKARNARFKQRENRFEVGDYVLIKRKSAPSKSALQGNKGTKHLMPYEGPFKVIKRTTSTLEVISWDDDPAIRDQISLKHHGPLLRITKRFVSPNQCKPYIGDLSTVPVYSDSTINKFLASLGYATAANDLGQVVSVDTSRARAHVHTDHLSKSSPLDSNVATKKLTHSELVAIRQQSRDVKRKRKRPDGESSGYPGSINTDHSSSDPAVNDPVPNATPVGAGTAPTSSEDDFRSATSGPPTPEGSSEEGVQSSGSSSDGSSDSPWPGDSLQPESDRRDTDSFSDYFSEFGTPFDLPSAPLGGTAKERATNRTPRRSTTTVDDDFRPTAPFLPYGKARTQHDPNLGRRVDWGNFSLDPTQDPPRLLKRPGRSDLRARLHRDSYPQRKSDRESGGRRSTQWTPFYTPNPQVTTPLPARSRPSSLLQPNLHDDAVGFQAYDPSQRLSTRTPVPYTWTDHPVPISSSHTPYYTPPLDQQHQGGQQENTHRGGSRQDRPLRQDRVLGGDAVGSRRHRHGDHPEPSPSGSVGRVVPPSPYRPTIDGRRLLALRSRLRLFEAPEHTPRSRSEAGGLLRKVIDPKRRLYTARTSQPQHNLGLGDPADGTPSASTTTTGRSNPFGRFTASTPRDHQTQPVRQDDTPTTIHRTSGTADRHHSAASDHRSLTAAPANWTRTNVEVSGVEGPPRLRPRPKKTQFFNFKKRGGGPG